MKRIILVFLFLLLVIIPVFISPGLAFAKEADEGDLTQNLKELRQVQEQREHFKENTRTNPLHEPGLIDVFVDKITDHKEKQIQEKIREQSHNNDAGERLERGDTKNVS